MPATPLLAANLTLTTFGPPLLGGMLLGVATALLLVTIGRIAGVSGILGNLVGSPNAATKLEARWRWAFLFGLVTAGLVARSLSETALQNGAQRPWTTLVIAGLLVGFGTRLGSGCTSGHGVCGVSRLSIRSIVATCTFVAVGALTVLCVRTWGGSL